jgi:purine nucleosidase
MPRPIIIDTDPGVDDAVAILLALAAPELDVRGLTVVAGNVELPVAAANARRILELAGRLDVPVHAGAAGPLRRPLVTATHFHGADGLGGLMLPEPTMALAEAHAVDFIIDTLRGADEPVTLCPLGPLTNIALALARAPDIVGRIAEIVLMGGSWRAGGNTTPAAEFNIWCDPDAAAAVFAAGAPIVMLPLDATINVPASPARCQRVAALGTPVAKAAAYLLAHGHDRAITRSLAGPPAHDPTVIAYLIEPGLFGGKACHVAVETESELTRGVTVVDWWNRMGAAANARVIAAADADGFYELLTKRLGRYKLPA